MPMFCGCMSSKQAKSPDKKKVKATPDKQEKANGDRTIQNGGREEDDAARKEQPVTASPAEPPAETHDVSTSQVDVRCPADVTATSDKSTSKKCQSFPPRPDTIIREDGLISEIESALSQTNNHGADKEPQTVDKNRSSESPQFTLQSSAITPSESDIKTTAATEKDSPQDAEESPPTPPPRPKTAAEISNTLSETGDRLVEANDEPPPSLPPRTAPPEKPPPVAEVENSELEEAPPTLPPRCVPPSPPRVSLITTAPPKPRRFSTDSAVVEDGLIVRKAKQTSFRKPPPLPEDWVIIELPKTDAELLKLTREPEQLASIASQYVIKHVNLHTDVRVTTELSEQIYAAFKEVATQHRSILQRFLTDLIEEQANSNGGDSQPAEPSHGAVIVLLREILRQFVNSESVVTVSLKVLRAVSRVPGATHSLVECDTTSALLSTMVAHKLSTPVQRYCMDVLAKIACFSPSVSQKAPLEQPATDLICLSLETFPKSAAVAQSACHLLNKLVTTQYTAVRNALDTNSTASEEQDKFVTGLLTLMDYVFTKSLPAVRSALKYHDQDSAVKTDGRKVLFIYAQLELLRQRKKQWMSGSSSHQSPPPLPARRTSGNPVDQNSLAERQEEIPEPIHREKRKGSQASIQGNVFPFNHSVEYENWDLLRGVLKKKSSLKGHGYSRADLQFMWQLTKTQVVALVCALAVDSHVEEALHLLGLPVADIVLTKEVPPGIRDFVAHQCIRTDTLIDLDPGLFVSLIDAVRYPSLSFQMAQKCVLEVTSSLNKEQQMPVVAVTVEFLASIITNRPLAPAMTVPAFVEEVCRELDRAKEVSQNRPALESLQSEIRQCARKTVHNN